MKLSGELRELMGGRKYTQEKELSRHQQVSGGGVVGVGKETRIIKVLSTKPT